MKALEKLEDWLAHMTDETIVRIATVVVYGVKLAVFAVACYLLYTAEKHGMPEWIVPAVGGFLLLFTCVFIRPAKDKN